MKQPKYVLALDPSGSFEEGKGTTGWVLLDIENDKVAKFGVLKASFCDSKYDYWESHINLIEGLSGYKPHVVIEDYVLYADKAKAQINSRLETPKLIGILEYECNKMAIPVVLQKAVLVKKRFEERILVHHNYLQESGRTYTLNGTKVVLHIRDALKHAVYYAKFKVPKL